MSKLNEAVVTLILVAVFGSAYFICSHLKRSECKLERFVVVVLWVISAVTGIYIFIGGVKAAESDPTSQNAIWGGVTGFILTLYSVEKIVADFKALFTRVIEPVEPDKRTVGSTK